VFSSGDEGKNPGGRREGGWEGGRGAGKEGEASVRRRGRTVNRGEVWH